MRIVEPLFCLLLAACGGDLVAVTEAPTLSPPDPIAGRAAFVTSCAGCHMSRDGWDLAYFGFADSTIVRRALKHVPLQTARDIAAHIRTLQVAPVGRLARPFQPGGTQLADDRAFALQIFGADDWPAEMDAVRLRAFDPRAIPVGLDMPMWSKESSDLDWMPNDSLPGDLLDAQGGAPRYALEAYYADPTLDHLGAAVVALGTAGEEAGPCAFRPKGVDPAACFEVRRWVASLVAVHFLRYGMPDTVDRVFSDTWWDVGDLARKITDERLPEHASIASPWLYMGWTFDQHRILPYLVAGLETRGWSRLATFVMMRSMVEQQEDRVAPYRNLQSAVSLAPAHWAANVLESGLNILIAQINEGNAPKDARVQEAADEIARAFMHAQAKAPAETQELEPLREQLFARLGVTTASANFDRAEDRRRAEDRPPRHRRSRRAAP